MKLHFTATGDAAEALAALRKRHDDSGPEQADVIVALGATASCCRRCMPS